MTHKITKQELEETKACAKRGAKYGREHYPAEYEKILEGMGLTWDGLDDWIDKTFEHVETTDEVDDD